MQLFYCRWRSLRGGIDEMTTVPGHDSFTSHIHDRRVRAAMIFEASSTPAPVAPAPKRNSPLGRDER
jgi:hypothetical protein